MDKNRTIPWFIPFTDDDLYVPFKEILIIYFVLGVFGVIILDVLICHLGKAGRSYFKNKEQDEMLRKEFTNNN